jgi:hypothetical protein
MLSRIGFTETRISFSTARANDNFSNGFGLDLSVVVSNSLSSIITGWPADPLADRLA